MTERTTVMREAWERLVRSVGMRVVGGWHIPIPPIEHEDVYKIMIRVEELERDNALHQAMIDGLLETIVPMTLTPESSYGML